MSRASSLSISSILALFVFKIFILDLTEGVSISNTSKALTGPCAPNCPCQVDGKYYNAGERWTDPFEPCTVYECLANGTSWRAQNDCLYRGECKPRKSVWTDGCSTFTCEEESNTAHYRIQDAGCTRNVSGKSSCLTVGRRVQSGCDVIECQINGQHLEIATVQYRCQADGECHSLGSFWHDGCTIYTCIKTPSGPQKKIATKATMEWPSGTYALLKSSTGCPSDIPEAWKEGSVTHFSTDLHNAFTNIKALAGNYTNESMRHEFCTHVPFSPATPGLPEYKTFWEPGSYCILKSGGTCPRGFDEGSVEFKDNTAKKTIAVGNTPDGEFTPGNNTMLVVCCREDGGTTTEIVLPHESSFVMFMNNKDRVCQGVKGMVTSQVEITMKISPIVTGSAPTMHQVTANKTTLTMCHYKPPECGCKDSTGQFIALNTEREIDCVVKKCVEDKGRTVMQIVSGGCVVENQCQLEDSIWTDFTGETCTKRICKRLTNNTDTTFVLEDVAIGCRDKETCKEVGTEIYRGCYTSSCVLDTMSNYPMFKVIRADCPWQDSCMPPNSTWDHNCMSYRCDMKMDSGHYKWNVLPVTYGCNDGKGNCYEVGQNVTDQCYDAVCRLNENKTVVYMDVIRGGCTWQDQCKPVNAEWTDGCHNFRCEWTTTETGFTATVNATSVSCSWNNTCYDHNATWSDGCVTYKCEVRRAADEVNWSVRTVGLACKDFKGNCVAVGESMVDNCVTYTCSKMGHRLRLEPITVGCQWNNTCTPEDSVWTDTLRCVDYRCHKGTGPTGTVMQVSVVGYGCVFNNTCKEVNSTWQDGCRTRKCVVKLTNTTIQRSISPVTAGCDDQGICRKVGFKKITDTCREYECVFNETYKDAFFTLSREACRSRNGECKMVGTFWTEIQKDICLEYECQKAKIGYVSKMLQKKCVDANGKCQAVGATGFSADVDGILQTDCMCEETGENIAIKCRTPTLQTK